VAAQNTDTGQNHETNDAQDANSKICDTDSTTSKMKPVSRIRTVRWSTLPRPVETMCKINQPCGEEAQCYLCRSLKIRPPAGLIRYVVSSSTSPA
jgi:hypothetical protein